MELKIEDIGPIKKKMTIEVPADKVAADLHKALDIVRRQAKIKGFRPGKVPMQMIKRLYGAQAEQEVAQNLMNEALPEALKETDLKLASSPNLEDSHFAEGEPYRFSVTFEVIPEFEVTGYEGLPLTKNPVNVTEDMVDKSLEDLRQSQATTMSVEQERPVQTGDLAVVGYKAFIGGEPVEGADNPSYQLEVGSGAFNFDFEAQLEGMNKGDRKEITVTFKDGYHNPKLAGQEVKFEVELIDINEKRLPDLDDDFAKDLDAEIGTLADLRTRIREDLTNMEKQRVENQVREQLKEKLLDLVEFDVPESLAGQEIESMISTTRFNLQRSGLSLETMGFSEEKMREDYQPEALKRVRVGLILGKIAQDQKLEVSTEDIQDKMAQTAKETGQPLEVIAEFYTKNNMLSSLQDSMLMEKTLNFLTENANIEDADTLGPAESGPGKSSEEGAES